MERDRIGKTGGGMTLKKIWNAVTGWFSRTWAARWLKRLNRAGMSLGWILAGAAFGGCMGSVYGHMAFLALGAGKGLAAAAYFGTAIFIGIGTPSALVIMERRK